MICLSRIVPGAAAHKAKEVCWPLERRALRIKSGDTELSGEIFRPGGPAPLVVLCHGIPLSLPDPCDPGYPELASRICESGRSVLFFNFRGTGGSGGDFSLGGWRRDLEAVMCLASEEAESGLYLAGFSAGGALAIRHAAEHGGVSGVAVFAPPARFEDVFPREHTGAFIELAREVGIIRDPRFPPSPDWFYQDLKGNAAIDWVQRLSPVPLLVVHGEDDQVVPLEQGLRIYEAAGEPKMLRVLPRGGHHLRHDSRSLECLLDWLDGMGG